MHIKSNKYVNLYYCLLCFLKIYPSEFGMKRMQEEEVTGPSELISSNPKIVASSNESDQVRFEYLYLINFTS